MGDKLLALSIIYLTIHFIVNVVLSYFAGAAEGVIFKHRIGHVSDNHAVQITPAGYTFRIWNLIFVWLLAAYIYLIVNIFRSATPEGNLHSVRRYCYPRIFDRYTTFYLILNAFYYTSWLFLWDSEMMTASAAVLLSLAVTGWMALVHFSLNLWNNSDMLKAEAPTDLILYQILVQNGLGLYTTWTTIASLINLAIAYVHDGGVEDPAPSLIALLFLTFILLIWTLLELMFWDKYFRYIMTPLFVVLWALCGIYVRQGDHPEKVHSLVRHYTFVMIIITGCVTAFRVALVFFRHNTRPLYAGFPARPLPVLKNKQFE